MRELVFTLDYEQGCNAVADTLAEYPDTRIRSLSLHATPESLWRVDHASGSSDSLDAVEDTFLTADYYADCLATEECGATRTTEVLDHSNDTLVLYSYWERTPTCASVPHIALNQLGDGILFETYHETRKYEWRIIHPGDGDIRAFLNAVDDAVGDCAEMEILRLTDATPPTTDTANDSDGLAPEQEAALQAAVEYGFYETPREVDVADLAERLNVPRSTLTYRLRRAEAFLAKRHTARTSLPESASVPS